MTDGRKVQRISAIPIDQVDPSADRTPLEFPQRYDAAWAEKCAQWLARDPQWHRHIGSLFSLVQKGVAQDEGAYFRLASLLTAMRKTPSHEGLSWSTVERGSGQLQPVRIPSMVAVIDGHLPQQYRRGTAFGRVLSDVAYWWYGGEVNRMARDAGLDEPMLQGLIAGRVMLPYYDDVEGVARGLGIPIHRLDVAWFADRFREELPRRPVVAGEKSTVRTQIIADIAAIRLGQPQRTVGEALAGAEQAIELARFIISAGIPAETALPLIAGMTSKFERFFDQVSVGVERMRQQNLFDNAAIAHFLAADHFMHLRQPGLAITMASLGSDDLIMGQRWEMAGVGAHYLRQGLGAYEALYRDVAEAASADGKKLDPRLVPPGIVVEQMRNKLSILENAQLSGRSGAVATDGPAIGGFASPRPVKSLEEILSTPARREALEEFQLGAPTLWREIVSSGRAPAIVEEAMAFADPSATSDAIPSVILHGAIRSVAARSGISAPAVPSDPGQFLVRGATITFGGLQIPVAALNPVVKVGAR